MARLGTELDCGSARKHRLLPCDRMFRGATSSMECPEREALLDVLVDLIIETNVRVIAGVIDVPAYARVAPKRLENEFLGNKYAAPFGAPVEYACQFMNRPNEPFPHDVRDTCAFFMEESAYKESAIRALKSIKNSPDLWWRDRIGGETFRSKKGVGVIPLPQLGDLGAFPAAKRVAKAPDGKIPWAKYFDKFYRAGRMFKVIRVDETSINKLHDLHEELNRKAAEGKDPWDDV